MELKDYTYELPEDRIAAHPPKIRGTSRLLALNRKNGEITDSFYKNIADFFEKGDLLILNDTKVIKARLFATKENGAERELVILERHSFDSDWHKHKVMYRGKLKAGNKLFVKNSSPEEKNQNQNSKAEIVVEEILGDGIAIVSSKADLRELCENFGTVPLPPYMRRDATPLDIERYQTVFAEEKGSVAAPTASLNMTEEILNSLRKKGVKIKYLTLHVGLGTFMPIRVEKIEEHKMHQEYFEIPAETAEEIRKTHQNGGRVFALGTTVARTLEYAHNAIFEKSLNGNSGNREDLSKVSKNQNGDLSGEADIFIFPGYEFKTIQGLITNFHAPKSTVLMLASAFAGWENLKNAYNHAIQNGEYKFLSYGDSMLIYQ
ncbi:MAG: tRNA preQ1(34) S-adenosylmethionine ribosyltransferase-isomerase QueA [Candidatus Nanogingivalaceae bacterium]|nr:tRNA preQ1(34) S-adenosylmethionine ribosyltransferase-isomerase QueA [Candidatus Nanogingivalaceae bacterium]